MNLFLGFQIDLTDLGKKKSCEQLWAIVRSSPRAKGWRGSGVGQCFGGQGSSVRALDSEVAEMASGRGVLVTANDI
jgi:hypothetical protein